VNTIYLWFRRALADVHTLYSVLSRPCIVWRFPMHDQMA
jgi:hypothetical protein